MEMENQAMETANREESRRLDVPSMSYRRNEDAKREAEKKPVQTMGPERPMVGTHKEGGLECHDERKWQQCEASDRRCDR